MIDTIPIKTLYKYLPFSKEAVEDWNEDSDILHFLYELYDKGVNILIGDEVISNGSYREYGKVIYDRGKRRLSDRVKKMEEIITNKSLSEDSEEDVVLSKNSTFGLVGKYLTAWDGIVGEVLSEDAFFSVAHVLESESDLNCSLELATNLYYRQACQVLRDFLIDLMMPIYFCDNQEEFAAWKNDDYKMPSLTGEEGIIYELVSSNTLPKKTGDRIKELDNILSDYTYGRESCLINKGIDSEDWVGHTFKEEDFHKWCELFAETVVLGIHLIRLNVNQWAAVGE